MPNNRSFSLSQGPECPYEQRSRILNRRRRPSLQDQRRWLTLQGLGQHVIDQLLQMRAAQAQGLGRFQANDQSAHVSVRRLHASKVGLSPSPLATIELVALDQSPTPHFFLGLLG
jgi:hypothetical protein